MKLYKIYFSPTGGTKKVADIMASAWDCEKEEIDIFHLQEPFDRSFHKDDVCLVLVPSYGGRVPEPAVERIQMFEGNGARAVLVAVYGNREFEDTLIELKDTLRKSGFRCCAAVSAIAQHSIFPQFAQGRPDENDKKELESYAEKIRKYLESEKMVPVKVPGNHPYRKYDGVPLKPTASKECTQCGLCAKQCPVHAISMSSLRKVDKKKCISCIHCVEICPSHARKTNGLLKMVAGKTMKKTCSKRKENKLYIG